MSTHIPEKQRVVVDTTALISYFPELFKRSPQVSERGLRLIADALNYEDKIILIVPSVVFIEIFDKWFRGTKPLDQEFRARFRSEVFQPLYIAPNVEIRELDLEVLEMFLSLHDPMMSLENHDRIVLASAAVLQCSLITSDADIKSFNSKHRVIPSIIS